MTTLYLYLQGQSDVEWVRHLNRVSHPKLDCIFQIEFESNTETTTLPSSIRSACSQGKAVVINNWISNGYETVFNVDTISKYRDVYNEIEWQGISKKKNGNTPERERKG